MQVQSLGLEGLLEEGIATHSSILAWRIPWTQEPGRLYSVGSQRVRHDGNDFSSVQLLSRVRLCDRMDRRTPGLPVHRQLPEFTQTRVHGVSDAIQPSHPLSAPSPTFNLSQHQGLFK